MQLVINGETKSYDGAPHLEALAECYAGERRVATLVNGEVVPAARRRECRLRENDKIELLAFAGGG